MPEKKKTDKGLLEKIYKAVFEPPEIVTEKASELANRIDEPSLSDLDIDKPSLSDSWYSPYIKGFVAGVTPQIRGFKAGATEGAASLLSPANILTLGRGRLPQLASKIIGAGQAAYGGKELAEGDILGGASDIGFGILGMKTPGGKKSSKGKVSSGALPERVELPPEFTAVGSEPEYVRPTYKSADDKAFEIAQERFNMGRERERFPGDVPIEADLSKMKPSELAELNKFMEKAPDFDPIGAGLETETRLQLREPSIEPDVLPSKKDIDTRWSANETTAADLDVVRRDAIMNSSDDELKEAVDYWNGIRAERKQYNTPGTREEMREIRNLQMELKNRGLDLSVDPDPYVHIPDQLEGNNTFTKRLASETGAMNIERKGPRKEPMIPGDEHYYPSDVGEELKPKYKFDEKTGKYHPLSEKGVRTGPGVLPDQNPNLTPDTYVPKDGTVDSSGKLQRVWDLSRGLMSVDLPFTTSAAFRQASPMVGTKSWFSAWNDARKSYGNKKAHEALMDAIESRPLFKRDKDVPSFAESSGLKLSDLGKYSKREEALRGELAEKIPGYGILVAKSNRAYTSFLNNVRADTFENLINDGKWYGTWDTIKSKLGAAPDIDPGRNPMKDATFAREIAEFVNTATGIGKLGYEVGKKDFNLESSTRALSNMFFSPRKIASEMRMLNPSTYIMADPFVRKQYAKAMARRVGTWWSIAGLASMAGAQVSKDPNSADFGKIKIGNTRIDPPGGLQQYLVLGHRMLPRSMGGGGVTSSTTGKFTPFGKGPYSSSRPEQLLDFSGGGSFATNRMHPTAKYILDLAMSSKKPVAVGDRTAQMFFPMLATDLAELVTEDNSLLPAVASATIGNVGMGVQHYGKGSFNKPKLTPAIDKFLGTNLEEMDPVLGK